MARYYVKSDDFDQLGKYGELYETIVKGRWTLFTTELKIDDIRKIEGVIEVAEC